MYFKGEVEAELRETNTITQAKFYYESDFEKYMKEIDNDRGLYPHTPQEACSKKG